MASLESPCYLLPHGAVRSSAYLCIPVDAALAARSPVLATLMASNGLKELPEGVTLDSFQSWCIASPKRLDGGPRRKLEPEEKALALQAGEKMRDITLHATDHRNLACTLADEVRDAVQYGKDRKVARIQNVLHSLSRQLRSLVFKQLRQEILDTRVCSEHSLIRITPSSSATTSNADSINADTLSLLSRTTRGLRNLRVCAGITTATSAALLSAALLHHSALSHLSLHRVSWCSPGTTGPAPADTLFRTLPRLSHLTSLALSSHTCGAHMHSPTATMATVRTLAAAIAALPALAAVALLDDNTTNGTAADAKRALQSQVFDGTPMRKRRRASAHIGRSAALSLDPVIAALSTAPALTSLLLYWHPLSESDRLAVRGLRGPFPALRRLELLVDEHRFRAEQTSDVHPLLGRLPQLHTLSVNYNPKATNEGLVLESVIAAAAQQPALRLLVLIKRGTEELDQQIGLPHRMIVPVGLPDETPGLRVCFEPFTGVPETFSSTLSSFSRLTSLHQLKLKFSRDSLGRRVSHSTAWRTALSPLTALQQMRELVVEIMCGHVGTPLVVEAVFLAPLHALTQLTALSIHTSAWAVQATVLAPQLAGLTALQRLCVHGLRYEAVDEVEACLQPLTALTELDIGLRPMDAAAVRSFVACAARMPLLRVGKLQFDRMSNVGPGGSDQEGAEEGWVRGLRDLPSRGKYLFAVGVHRSDASTYNAVRQELIGRGADVSRRCEEVNFDGAVDEVWERRHKNNVRRGILE